MHLQQNLHDPPLIRAGRVSGHIDGIPGGIEGNLLQVLPGYAVVLEADRVVQLVALTIALYSSLLLAIPP